METPVPHRLLFGALVVLLVGLLVVSAAVGPVDAGEDPVRAVSGGPKTDATNVTDDSVIVMTGQTFGDRPGDALMAFKTKRAQNSRSLSPDGLLYYNNSYDEYHDVDPVHGTRMTVLYVASTHLSANECDGTRPCTFNVIERLNMTTGETTRFYTAFQPREEGNDIHDVDRISDCELLIADTVNDRVFILNTTTDLITWEWDAQSAYPVNGGGPYPDDWTHLNDVEYLSDRGENGWIMVSLRNQDQVVFVDREQGLVENWTLGREDDHDILYEQHNPDYIPPENGGPAVLVADSQNDRVVEYQRVDGEWERTWARHYLDWPRDADRLPNGHTLIVDSNGGRLLEFDENGRIAWSTLVPYERDAMYEAEVLGTGDESTGGPSAASINLSEGRVGDPGRSVGRTDDSSAPAGALVSVVLAVDRAAKSILPPKLRNAVLFVIPVHATPGEVLVTGTLLSVLALWGALELRLRWSSDIVVTFQSPIRIRRK